MASVPLSLVWFRRDLRLHDHPALTAAGAGAVGVYVFDRALLDRSDRRTAFLLGCLAELRAGLRARGGELLLRSGAPAAVLPALAHELGAGAVLWTSDVSPYARRRDRGVTEALRAGGIAAGPQGGNYVVDISKTGRFGVFSPYQRAWAQQERRAVLPAPGALAAPSGAGGGGVEPGELPGAAPGALDGAIAAPGEQAAREALERALTEVAGGYSERRNLVSGGTSALSPHLRWGTLSAREAEERLVALPARGPAALRRQLAWRDFNAHLLLFHPNCLRDGLKPRDTEWDEAPEHFAAWREGRTGFGLVDAGMRQLAATGWMHNRARMITASFLVHDLHVDWRRGERHFARELLDYEPAQNSLNWQWVAGVGADPGEWLRIFNPDAQAQEHDPDGAYVARWAPEPTRIVDHAAERRVALARFEGSRRVA